MLFRAKDINILISYAQPKQFIFAVCLLFKKSLFFLPALKMLFYKPVQIFMCVVPTVPSVVLTNIFTNLHCSDEMHFPKFLSQR